MKNTVFVVSGTNFGKMMRKVIIATSEKEAVEKAKADFKMYAPRATRLGEKA